MRTDDAGLAWDILQRYDDPATAAFDAVLAGAGVTEQVARALRFWQRESVANVKQYAAEALPAVFGAIGAAQRDAGESTRRAGAMLAGTADPASQAWVRDVVVTLPERATEDPASASQLEERRRTVAARLAQFG